jgi:putative transposase
MPENLKRYYGLKHLHFITRSCYHQWPLLQTVHARNLFVQIQSEVRERYGFALVGYVVMPNHVHLLIGEPTKGTPSTVMQVLKQRESRRLRRAGRKHAASNQLQFHFDEPGAQPPHFWQRRFHGFNVWSQKKWREKLEYMHLNPVKRKLVTDPKDWPWSSYPAYAGRGVVLTGINFDGN